MTDKELLTKVLEKHGFVDDENRRNAFETDIELAARILDTLCDFVMSSTGALNQLVLANSLEDSRIADEWRSEELLP